MRVSVHLLACPDGERLWSERLTREFDDLFALLDELAGTIAAAVAAEIDAREKARARIRPLELLTAGQLSLRTNEILAQARIEGFAQADLMMARAVALEPHKAAAHVQRSLVIYRKAMSGAWPTRTSLDQALEAAGDALRLDPRLPSAHVMAAVALGMRGETDAALDAALSAARLNPNAWGASHARSVALAFAPPDWAARHDRDAASLIEAAFETLRLAPASAFRSGHLALAGLGLLLCPDRGDLEPAITELRKSAASPGAFWWPQVFLALASLRGGDDAAASKHVSEARTAFPILSLAAVQSLFGASRLWPGWQGELQRLPELGLPED